MRRSSKLRWRRRCATYPPPAVEVPAKRKYTKKAKAIGPHKSGCKKCGKKGHYAKTCPEGKPTPIGKSLDADEKAWHAFKPLLNRQKYSEVRGLMMEEKNSAQIVAALDLRAEDIDDVKFAMTSQNYVEYERKARAAAG